MPPRPGRRPLVAALLLTLLAPSAAVAAPSPAAEPTTRDVATEVPGLRAQVEPGPGLAPTDDDCVPLLPRARHGARAVAELGERLPEVAAEHGLTARDLRARLAADDALHVDRCGALYYVDEHPDELTGADDHDDHGHQDAHDDHGHHDGHGYAAATTNGPTVEALAARQPVVPLDETFALHSRPGSSRTIHLAFGGRTLSGSAWNDGRADPIVLPPFSLDADPRFSTDELVLVQRVWQRVAEDFAPFDVDVTTETPPADALVRTSAADQSFGTRAIITSHDPAIDGFCDGCAGVGLLGTFAAIGARSTDGALVFVDDTVVAAQRIADTVSHEVGHNLGLHHHDDTGSGGFGYSYGQGLWTPLMGSSVLPLSTWSVGDYAGATTVQDDVATIAATGAPVAVDDHGRDAATATSIGAAATVEAVIGSRDDEDWFRFTADGPTVLTATPAAEGPNLDLELTLFAADGTSVVATDDPPSAWPHVGGHPWVFRPDPVTGLDAAIARDLPAGSYYARVRGVGAGDPSVDGYSDYGSLGGYTLQVSPEGTVPPPPDGGPALTITGAPASVTNQPTVSFLFAASPATGATYDCRVDTGPWQPCTSPHTVTVTAQGAHSFSVRATVDGATSPTVSRAWTLDTVAPTLTLTGTPAAGATTDGTVADLSWTPSEPLLAATRCRLLRDGATAMSWRDCGNEFGGGIRLTGLSPAGYRLEVQGTDLAGNVGTASRTWTVTGATSPPPSGPAPTFSDVTPGSTHAANIAILAEREVTLGCGGGRFCPDQPVTRDQMATFLGRALELSPGSSSPPFLDVAAGSTHARYIDAVRRERITLGCGDGRRYCPGDTVQRDQMASFLTRALAYEPGSASPPFRDVASGSTHARAIDALRREEVTTGCSTPGSYCPGASVTRAQMATFLVRALDW